MAQFCTCGSLMINESCTNKNCINKVSTKTASSAAKKGKAAKAEKPAKSTRTRRSSKCITYNLYENKEEES